LFLATTKKSGNALRVAAGLDSHGTIYQLKYEKCMLYSKTHNKILIGDRVTVDGKIKGIVVCDYDSWKCLNGYESWLTREKLVGFGSISSGVMVETREFGFLHYADEDEDIAPDTSLV
jgi:hypothetical protein